MQNKRMIPHITAALWGFAEATIFFIVPDVFLTYRGLKGYRSAVLSCLYALAGALLGGVLMFVWAQHSVQAINFVQHVPAVTTQMASTARSDYAHHGVVALLIAPFKGIPYKLYTVITPEFGVGIISFTLVSALARFGRFVITAMITAAISSYLSKWLSHRQRAVILAIFWVVFYALYFYRNL